jgi:hypothetical protein
MKKNLNLIIVVMGLILSSCNHKPGHSGTNNRKQSNDCLPDSLSALAQGKKLLIDKYEYLDSTNHTFSAVLSEDSIWHVVAQPNLFENEQIKDTIPINRGSERVLIN